MPYKILTAAGVALAFALPAAAQQTAQPNQSHNSSASQGQQQAGSSGMNIRQTIIQDLEKAGYKNVQVAPASFVAQATDKQGQPVMMVINPDSVTTITPLGGSGQQASSQSNTGSGSGANGSSTKH